MVREKERKSTAELSSQLCTESAESSLESEAPIAGGKRPQSKPTQHTHIRPKASRRGSDNAERGEGTTKKHPVTGFAGMRGSLKW